MSTPTAPEVADLIKKMEAAYEWIREPDWAEVFNATDHVRWMNSRPCGPLLQAATALRSLQAERDRLAERVKELINTLDGIRIYGSDTLSGNATGPDDANWYRLAVREMTKRAAILTYGGDDAA
ncbi:hypothetical protein GCM10011491_30290 [Brucella endophytica]|uniref:Uncharacterized protein n=1 Tax=Brucella endophytica TaxID=1963359 RepID=A0A916SHQ9_9HYPH|nr:hypothetical protein [Brucella endophytica]GGA99988.1 hypothetical protein GCM10011491_30290 [Brucella endophytica]